MIRRLLLVFVGLLAAWLAACAFLFVWPRAASAPSRADAVVVLSGARNERLDPAIALVERGVAPLLVISSPGKDPRWLKARRLCRAGALSRSVRVLCFEAHPFSTRGEARAIARLAAARHWRRVVVVSSTFHLTRARMLIRRCYSGELTMVGARSPWWRLPEEWASETGKLLVQLTVERRC
ncbi:MAG TPA: YdcF family protein [Gaiellaceae bacterium]